INHHMETYLASNRDYLEDLEKNGMTARVNMLRGVTVTAEKESEHGGIYSLLSGNADQTIRFDNIGHCTNLLLCLQGKIQGVIFRSEGQGTAPYSRGERMSVILNGRIINDEMELTDILENGG